MVGSLIRGLVQTYLQSIDWAAVDWLWLFILSSLMIPGLTLGGKVETKD